jgi:hypothetical protein
MSNRRKHIRQAGVFQYIRRRKSKDPHALLNQPPVANGVVPNPVRVIMTRSVNLDRKSRRRTIEIEHVWPDRMLAAEAEPIKATSAKRLP